MIPIRRLCQLAGVSRSGYYGYMKSDEKRKERERKDEADFQMILQAYRFKNRHKGIRQVKMTLYRSFSVKMNHKKIQRLMRKYGLYCPIRKANPYRRLQKALKTSNYAPNVLNREFYQGVGKVILSDITYLHYGKGKIAYLSTTKDPVDCQII